MNISNYPAGFLNGVLIRGIPIVNTYSGRIYWVSSTTGSNGNHGKTPQKPFATLNYAIGRCRANWGDIIFVMPAHVETLSLAGAIACNVAGISILGLGSGAARPTFTFSAVDATMLVSATSVTIENIVIRPSVNGVVNPIVISGSNCYLDVEVQDASATVECVRAVLTTATADLLTLNLVYRGFIAGTTCVNAIRLVGCDTAKINVNFYGRASIGVIEFHTTSCFNIEVGGIFYNEGITNHSRNVVATVSSTWSVNGFDAMAGVWFSGGSSRAVAGDLVDLQEQIAIRPAATMVNNQIIFTVAGGPIKIMSLVSVCQTPNDATASTLQYSVTPTVGSATTISGASVSLASAAAGASVTLAGTTLATAPSLSAGGPNLIANPGTIFCPIGTIRIVVGVGSTTGTWAHHLRYRPLAANVLVS